MAVAPSAPSAFRRSVVLPVVCEEFAEQAGELVAFGGGERGEQGVLDAGEGLPHALEFASSGGRDGDDVAPSVRGVGCADDEVLRGEFVDGGDDVAAVDAASAAEVCLAGGAELVEGREDPVVVAAGADAAEAVADQPAGGLLRALPAGGSELALTDAGREVQRRVADAVAGVTARLYGDVPAADLAVAGRVLTLVKQRADAELAAAGNGTPAAA